VTPREVIGAYLAAMQRGDRAAAAAFYAADVVMHVPGRSAYAGARRGRAAVTEYLAAAVALADEGVEAEFVDMLAGDGERVALLLRETLRSGARGELVIRRANVYTVRGDRIAEVRIYEHDQHAVDAFLGEAS
jgi:ketosteroid isomerase-like protein